MTKGEWNIYCDEMGGSGKYYTDQEGGIVYLIEVFENGAWGLHSIAGTRRWAISRAVNRLQDADDWRITEHSIQ